LRWFVAVQQFFEASRSALLKDQQTMVYVNEITVQFEDGRDLIYNPQRLSGVSVYREAKRSFSEGDRMQFRAPFAQQGIANGELRAIEKIEDDKFTVVLESGKEVGSVLTSSVT
jgi:hypothetical protein